MHYRSSIADKRLLLSYGFLDRLEDRIRLWYNELSEPWQTIVTGIGIIFTMIVGWCFVILLYAVMG